MYVLGMVNDCGEELGNFYQLVQIKSNVAGNNEGERDVVSKNLSVEMTNYSHVKQKLAGNFLNFRHFPIDF
jgi:hypothetical protein